MSRYIDVNEFYDKMYEWARMHGGIIRNEMQAILEAVSYIDIVRCKECKHWHREIDENGVEYVNFSKCTKGHYGNGLNFHCADGERREP